MKEEILKIIDIFFNQSMGDKVTEFSMIGLKVVLGKKIDEFLSKKSVSKRKGVIK